MDFAPEEDFYSQKSSSPQFFRILSQRYQSLLDASTPHITGRWIFAVSLLVFFMFRVVFYEGWYIIAYALGIYFLNLLIAFLTPKIDPALNFDDDTEGPSLPTSNDEEFRPFIRRLAEFKFWHSVCVSTLISIVCTFFDFLNVPVFWPILLLYFITLFCITMKRQIMHMIKYRYLPWTRGKKHYGGREDAGRVYYK